MDVIQEGGVLTQKVSVTLGVIALLMLGAMVCCIPTADAEGEQTDLPSVDIVRTDVEKDGGFIGVNTSLSDSGTYKPHKAIYTVKADKALFYRAELLDASDISGGKVASDNKWELEPDSGIYTDTLTVTAPLTSGDFRLVVKFYTDSSRTDANYVCEKTVPLRVVDPIVLSFTLENKGGTAVTFNAYFTINGEKNYLDDPVTVPAGGTKEVTYNYYVRDVPDELKYSLGTDDPIVKDRIKGLNEEKTFYAHDSDYTVITVIVVVVLIIMVLIALYIRRKPVINKGKPKGRR